jgi:hypothetical protein
VWWPLATAQQLAQEHTLLGAVNTLSSQQAHKITLLEERLELRSGIEKSLQLQVDALEEGLDGAAAREAELRLQNATVQQRLERSRWLWASIGAAVVAVIVGGAWGLSAGL